MRKKVNGFLVTTLGNDRHIRQTASHNFTGAGAITVDTMSIVALLELAHAAAN